MAPRFILSAAIALIAAVAAAQSSFGPLSTAGAAEIFQNPAAETTTTQPQAGNVRIPFAVTNPGSYAIDCIRDLTLIYQGGRHRIAWTEEQILPYVVHTFANGHKEWLFDGFLFIEFIDGNVCRFIPAATAERNARRDDWQRYMDSLFQPGKALHALDDCISHQKAILGAPGFRHRVVLTLPMPIPGQKDWGEVDGRPLDFDVPEDAVAACRWYIDAVVERFNAAGFENIDLSGIYWVAEDCKDLGNLPSRVAPYVHAHNLQFMWIPWFKAPGYDQWRSLGFDIAYMQPNHFVSRNTTISRVNEACEIARRYGMALEYECDESVFTSNPEQFTKHMQDYITSFNRNRVFKQSALAYYTGNHLIADFVNHPAKKTTKLMDKLARIIVNRRSYADLVPR